jgi:hypothetical protein
MAGAQAYNSRGRAQPDRSLHPDGHSFQGSRIRRHCSDVELSLLTELPKRLNRFLTCCRVGVGSGLL